MIAYINPIIGGLLIGLSATMLLIGSGRVAGISGLLANALFKNNKVRPLLFLTGLVVGGVVAHNLLGVATADTSSSSSLQSPTWVIIVSGLLVGYGTRLGSGCTSGHGVCGIPRLSIRSIVATCLFMSTAILTVAITR
ncbi:YeeE/YedE family protein [Marinomonas mediterranea]|jgi:Predicted transporter component|uniref:Uncharacterized protein n=1 Tax=Marinomonas mediterranea (strain ATCC 700492 / JCM 21426 / NBRC 103028 / MMB-1) TaxID=717774 RepID=F2K2S3_MARM1|nr:protein of unknown function DUF395 YeeE/YedE [Marinomonas mediterranea MMB-1]WCN13264.1 YeeE/YedE family protein [Marinomonas mediterranea]WCN17332.1 YeeE/YedE family protein [Marinomonas mediterranea MMB-1]